MPRWLSVVVILGLLSGCGGPKSKRLNAGEVAPAFEAERLAGGRLRFPEDLKGKVVVIRFWADWCSFCEGEMKAVDVVFRRHHSTGLEVLAINAGQDRGKVLAFMTKIGVSYPALLDEAAIVSKRYGVGGLPTTFIVDRTGVVQEKLLGEVDSVTFERKVLAVLR